MRAKAGLDFTSRVPFSLSFSINRDIEQSPTYYSVSFLVQVALVSQVFDFRESAEMPIGRDTL